MKVLALKFENYRNLDDAIITPCDGVNVIYGDNAQGKTNLLEAFWMFCGGHSFRGSKDNELIGFGKPFAKQIEISGWKKKSIFFELPYWKSLYVRHFLDVMHIEKNICDSLIGTLLNIQGKIKDSVNSRLDLVNLGIREELAPIE